MSVHYKFKSSLDFDTVTFDGLHISVADLKKSILQLKKIGKAADFDLQITNAQTKEVYTADDILIPKNTSVIISRVPVASAGRKNWERNRDGDHPPQDVNSPGHNYEKFAKIADLANSKASEDDKIKAMMSQSSQEYDPSKYVKSRSMTGPLPPNYTCFRCGKSGHWIKNCPTNNVEVKRSTGIPRSFMVTVDGPDHKGALLTSTGEFAVPLIDHEAYKEVKKEKPPFMKEPTPEPVQEPQLPEELLCMICRDLLQDAVLIPCCGNSFCDECVRQDLLDSEQHECPVCHECDISPNNLIPNRFLRTAVLNFKNETGYTRVKRGALLPTPVAPVEPTTAGTATPPPSTSSASATPAIPSTSSAMPADLPSASTESPPVEPSTSGSSAPATATAEFSESAASATAPATVFATPPPLTEEAAVEEKSPAVVADVGEGVKTDDVAADVPMTEDGSRSPIDSMLENPPGTPLADERPDEDEQLAPSLDEALTMSPQQRSRHHSGGSSDGDTKHSSAERGHHSPSVLDNGGDSVCAIATITTRVPTYGVPVSLPGRPGREPPLDASRGSIAGRGPLHRSGRHGDYGHHRSRHGDYGPGNSMRSDYRGPLYPNYPQNMAGGGYHPPPPLHMPPVPPPQGHLPPPGLPPPPFPGQAVPPGMANVGMGPAHYPITSGAGYINPAKPFGAEEYHGRRRSRRAGDPLEEFEKHLRNLHRNRRGGRRRSKTRSRSSSFSRSRSKSRPRSGASRSYSPRSYSRSPRSASRYSASSRSYSRSRSRSYSRSPRSGHRSRSRSAGGERGSGGRGRGSKSPRGAGGRRSRSGSYRSRSRSPGRQRRGHHHRRYHHARRTQRSSRSPRSPRSYHHHPLPHPMPPPPHAYRGRTPPPPPFRGHHRRGHGPFFGGGFGPGFPPDHVGVMEFDDRSGHFYPHDGGFRGFQGYGGPGGGGMPPPDMGRDRRYDQGGPPPSRYHSERHGGSRMEYAPDGAIPLGVEVEGPPKVGSREGREGRDGREGREGRESRGREYSYRRQDHITMPLVVREGEERQGKERKLEAEVVKTPKKRLKEREEKQPKHKHHHKVKESKKDSKELLALAAESVKPTRVKPPKVIVVPPSLETKAAAEAVKVEKVTPVEQGASAAAVVVIAKEKKRTKKVKLEEALKKAAAVRTSDDSSQLPGIEEEPPKRKKKKKKLKDGKLVLGKSLPEGDAKLVPTVTTGAKEEVLLVKEAQTSIQDGEPSSAAKVAPNSPVKTEPEEGLLEDSGTDEKDGIGEQALASAAKPAENVLQVELPELSKWEREELEEEELPPTPPRRPQAEEARDTKPALSSEVLQRAENVLLHKPLKTAIVAAAAIRLGTEKRVSSKAATSVLEDSTAARKSNTPPSAPRESKEGRKEASLRLRDRLDGTLQVTITSDKERRSVLTEKEQRSSSVEGQLKRIKLDRSKFVEKVPRSGDGTSQGDSTEFGKPTRSSSSRREDRKVLPEPGSLEIRAVPSVGREERAQRERGSSSRLRTREKEMLRTASSRDHRLGMQEHSRSSEADRRRRKEERYHAMMVEDRMRRSYEDAARREAYLEAEYASHDRRRMLMVPDDRPPRFLMEDPMERSRHERRDPRFRLDEREMQEQQRRFAQHRLEWPPPLEMVVDKGDRSHHYHHQERSGFAIPSAAAPQKAPSSSTTLQSLRIRKESTQDESRFEPDYDEMIEEEGGGDGMQKGKRKLASVPVTTGEVVPARRPRIEQEPEGVNPTIPVAPVVVVPPTVAMLAASVQEEKSSSSSSDSSEEEDKQHKKHKKKHKKHKKHKKKHKKHKKSKKLEKTE